MRQWQIAVAAFIALNCTQTAWPAEPTAEVAAILSEVRMAQHADQLDEALRLANLAVSAAPKSPQALFARASVLEARREFAAAIRDYDAILNEPKSGLSVTQRADLLDQRGSAHLFAGQMPAAIADFDEAIRLEPKRLAGHWQRGIAYYYANRFDEGARQFEAYQTIDDNDVENAVWWFLCKSRLSGEPAARKGLLKIGRDARVPMMTVYELFGGDAKPDAVIEAARAGTPNAAELRRRLFYAHLYLGLWYEAQGDAAKSLEHMQGAAKEFEIASYMGQVAKVHFALRKGDQ